MRRPKTSTADSASPAPACEPTPPDVCKKPAAAVEDVYKKIAAAVAKRPVVEVAVEDEFEGLDIEACLYPMGKPRNNYLNNANKRGNRLAVVNGFSPDKQRRLGAYVAGAAGTEWDEIDFG